MPDKPYRIAVVALLVLIVALQGFSAFKVDKPSDACVSAINEAVEVNETTNNLIENVLANYEDDVYDRADNINQQILLSNENLFFLTNAILRVNNAILNVQQACE